MAQSFGTRFEYSPGGCETTISDNIFERCAPALGTNAAACGTCTACEISTATPEMLTEIFQDEEGHFRNMSSLLVTEFEMKACGARVNSMFDFFMANKKSWTKRLRSGALDQWGTRYFVEPFIMAAQDSVINPDYWQFTNGLDPGGTPDWQIDVTSRHGMPINAGFFNDRDRIYANGVSPAGTVIRAAYRVYGATVVGGVIRLQLISENYTLGPAAKAANPLTGFLTKGPPNVQDVESYCQNIPGINPAKNVPFWIEWVRWDTCWSDMYESYWNELTKNNPLFARFGDIPEAKVNKQISEAFQRSFVEALIWNKPISANQTLALYHDLEEVTLAESDALDLPTGAICVGHRANSIGWYEQLQQCGRVFDLQGNPLNLVELFEELIYQISRSRGDQGGNGDVIDIFTDRTTRANFQLAMMRYYNYQSDGQLRLVMQVGQSGAFGFNYDSYKLVNPAGVTINIISSNTFDDFKAEAQAGGVDNAGNMLWILDMGGLYPGIIDSNKVVNSTGNISDLAKVDLTYLCTMTVPKGRVSMNSLGYTAVLECPDNNAILEGFNDEVPEVEQKVGSYQDYYGKAEWNPWQ